MEYEFASSLREGYRSAALASLAMRPGNPAMIAATAAWTTYRPMPLGADRPLR